MAPKWMVQDDTDGEREEKKKKSIPQESSVVKKQHYVCSFALDIMT